MNVRDVYTGAQWPLAPVASMADLVNGYPFDSADFLDEGEIPLVRIRDLSSDSFGTYLSMPVPDQVVLRDGDIVVGMDGDFNVVRWTRGPAALNQRLCRLRAKPGSDIRYVGYALPEPLRYINETQYSTTVRHLSSGEILSCRIPQPSLQDQRRIADYLDAHVARVDDLLRLRESQIERVREAMASQTSTEVRHLLDSAPAVALRRLLVEVDERAGEGSDLPLLSVSIHRGVVPRSELSDDPHRADNLNNYKCVARGDLVLNRMRAFQGAVGVASMEGLVSPDYAVLRLDQSLDPWFFHFLFRSDWFVGQMTVRLRGIGSADLGNARTPRINVSDLMDIAVPVPSVDEQRDVIGRLRAGAERGQSLIGAMLDQQGTWREYRRSLVISTILGATPTTEPEDLP